MGRACNGITAWTEFTEMAVNIAKCGIMEVRPEGTEPILTADHEIAAHLKICGKRVPIVETYKYLGLNLDTTLCPRKMAQTRLTLAQGMYGPMRPYLTCPEIPCVMRLRVFRAVVVQTLLYGAEIYGMRNDHTQGSQTFVNKCIRQIMQIPFDSDSFLHTIVPMWIESGVPVLAAAAARAAP